MKRVERLVGVSNIERELLFRKWLEKKQVDELIFDLDGTISNTYPPFLGIYRMAMEIFAVEYGNKHDTAIEALERLNKESFNIKGVNPNRWEWILDQTELELGSVNKEVKKCALEKFGEMYKVPLEMIPGAEETLLFVRKTEHKPRIVTLANEPWSRKKYNWMLREIMPWEDVYIVDENGRKGPEQWMRSMEYFRVEPERVMVVGDSYSSDIAPCEKIGVRTRVLVRNQYSDWGSLQESEKDSDTYLINDIKQLMDLGGELLRHKTVFR